MLHHYIYVSMYACMHACMHTRMHAAVHACMHARLKGLSCIHSRCVDNVVVQTQSTNIDLDTLSSHWAQPRLYGSGTL